MRTLRSLVLLLAFTTGSLYGQSLTSPDGQVELYYSTDPFGTPTYRLVYHQQEVIKTSRLGFLLREREEFKFNEEAPADWAKGKVSDFTKGFVEVSRETTSLDETWSPVLGEESEIRNHYNELDILLEQTGSNRFVQLEFRLFDDGLGFRYNFPQTVQKGTASVFNALNYFTLVEEKTEFAMTGDHTAWWVMGDYDTQENAWQTSNLSEIPVLFRDPQSNVFCGNASTTPVEDCVQTSLQMKTDQGLYINLHEAACIDYSTMHLKYDVKTNTFTSWLTPDAEGFKGHLQTPCVSPWRTVIVSDCAEGILASRMTLNLNEPCKLEDTSWIRPCKYMGIWWEMITNKCSWSYTDDLPSVQLGKTDYSQVRPNGRHGATTEKALRYIAKAADGSMRDGLSLLDQCIAFYIGQPLTYDNVLKVLGAIDTEVFSRLLRNVINGNITDCINILEEIIGTGRDLNQFVIDFTWYLRNLMLLKTSDDMEEVLEMSSDNLVLLKEEAQMVDTEILMRYIQVLSSLSNDLKFASGKRVLIEIALIKLCKPEMEQDISALNNRMANLEKKVENGVPMVMAHQVLGQSDAPSPVPVKKDPDRKSVV